MKRTFLYNITEEAAGCTVMEFMKQKGYSRHILAAMKEFPGSIQLNGERVFLTRPLCPGDLLSVALQDSASSEKITPVPLPLNILYEDEDILVLNKPADMPIHPSMGNYDNTLANAAAYYYQQQGEHFVFRCINRLDRDTTGALVLGKHALSAALLSSMMQRREIHRTYLAVVLGTPPEEGSIDAPIARVSGSTIERQVDPLNGERAVTHFRRLQSNGTYSLVQLRLKTGRTHQIRVHMKHLGYPLPGDFLYCPDFTDFQRQPLHSWKLEFLHPITGAPLCFTARIPEDFQKIFPSMFRKHFPMR